MGIKTKRPAFNFDDTSVAPLGDTDRPPSSRCPCCGQPLRQPVGPRKIPTLEEKEKSIRKLIQEDANAE